MERSGWECMPLPSANDNLIGPEELQQARRFGKWLLSSRPSVTDEEGHDAVIAGLMRAARKYDIARAAFRTYAEKLIRWEFASLVRRKHRETVPFEESHFAGTERDPSRRLLCRQLLARLSERDAGFLLRCFSGETLAAIGAEYNISESGALRRRDRLLARLRQLATGDGAPATPALMRRLRGRGSVNDNVGDYRAPEQRPSPERHD